MDAKILVVDDESVLCELVKQYLEREGFTVYTAADGTQALAAANKFQPDLIILDVMLPEMSGWEVCKKIQHSAAVIFLSARSTEYDKLTGFSLGAADYITKPFSPKELVARVKTVLFKTG